MRRTGKIDLGFFCGFLEALQSHLVLTEVDAVFLFEFVGDPIHDHLIEIIATQMRIAVGGLYFEHAIADFQNGNVERATAQVIDRDGFICLFVQPVGQSRRSRLVHNAQYFKTRDASCILSGLTLCVIEISRNGNHGLRDRFAQIIFGNFFHGLKNHG